MRMRTTTFTLVCCLVEDVEDFIGQIRLSSNITSAMMTSVYSLTELARRVWLKVNAYKTTVLSLKGFRTYICINWSILVVSVLLMVASSLKSSDTLTIQLFENADTSTSTSRLLHSNVLSMLLYGSYSWKVATTVTQQLQAFTNNCIRHVIRILRPEKILADDLSRSMG